ncbi:MAG TPA: ABC transporter substrate-binding protein [Spirochaetia bacterium]|nr:ABC transporter substrate-binding protein [Spirochaetia bacterium]
MVFLCAALLVSVTIGHSAVRDVERVRVLVPQTTAALPFLRIAGEHPLAGADIEVRMFANHAQALALLLRGDADLLLSGTSQGWENRLDGSPIVMIDTGVWALASLVGRDPAIRTFADLRGKRLALPFPGSPLDFQTRALLARAGVDLENDVSISYGPFAQSVSRLLAGQIDAAPLPEPVASEVVRKNGLLRLAEYSRAWAAVNGGDGRSPQVSLFATERFASAHRPLLVTLVEAWRESSREISRDPEEAARKYSPSLGLEPDILAEATRRTYLEVPDLGENQSRVLEYYRQVAPYLPGQERSLDAQFFLVP